MRDEAISIIRGLVFDMDKTLLTKAFTWDEYRAYRSEISDMLSMRYDNWRGQLAIALDISFRVEAQYYEWVEYQEWEQPSLIDELNI